MTYSECRHFDSFPEKAFQIQHYEFMEQIEIPGVKKLFEGIDYFNKRLPKEKRACHYFGVHGALDYLSIFRGSGQFMLDLFDSPAKVRRIFSYITERSLQ